MPVVLAPKMLRQENLELQATLGYIVNHAPTLQQTYLKNKKPNSSLLVQLDSHITTIIFYIQERENGIIILLCMSQFSPSTTTAPQIKLGWSGLVASALAC